MLMQPPCRSLKHRSGSTRCGMRGRLSRWCMRRRPHLTVAAPHRARPQQPEPGQRVSWITPRPSPRYSLGIWPVTCINRRARGQGLDKCTGCICCTGAGGGQPRSQVCPLTRAYPSAALTAAASLRGGHPSQLVRQGIDQRQVVHTHQRRRPPRPGVPLSTSTSKSPPFRARPSLMASRSRRRRRSSDR